MTHLQPQSKGRCTGSSGAQSSPITVRSFVLLAGGVRATSLQARVGRSVLDLPVSDSLHVFDVWRLRIRELLDRCSFPDPEVRVLAGSSTAMPAAGTKDDDLRLSAERDASRYRGTAGVLRDLGRQFGDEDHILVGTASQCPDEGQIRRLVMASDPSDGLTLSADAEGAPTGLMLIRCGALADVPEVGFVDLKEQALPRIAERHGVRVVDAGGPATLPMRTMSNYVDAVRSWHRSGSLRGTLATSPFEERWKPAFAIVEPDARVDVSARIHDSVVLSGAVVEAGSVVVRSVVGPGGRARRRQQVVGQLVIGKEVARQAALRASEGEAQ